MKLFHFSSQTEDQQLNNLHQEFEDPFFSLSIKRIVEKIDVDDSQVFLISSHKPQAFYLNSFAGDKDLIIQLHEIWHQYINNNDNEQESCKNNFWVEFNKFGKHVLTSDDETLFLFHSPQEQQINTYFLLLKNNVLYLTIIKYLFILSLFRHLQIVPFTVQKYP